ncbi:MAG: anthranilate synthase component I [Thermodesulfobacteriota bacterium]|nr:anthranilate synthase component I [Deltaproteobacteria bacterium TMED58]RZP15201.1 MAG: anthranilate synthase component I [Candidatus Dadabacteria bacterium]|tara:strand:- start:7699 stop:9180 length:1482 start_codon:yes stop_codon:yes gene_type:complete
MISLTLENFKALSKKGNLIPIFKEISLDYDNPLSILKKISSKKYCFLLESSDGPEKWSQYSFLGFDPNLIISSEKNKITIKSTNNKTTKLNGDIFVKLKEIMGDFKPVIVDNLPRFYGGLVGFFSYEIINQIENIFKNSGATGDFPDSLFMLTDSVIIFDNINKTAKIVINAHIKDSNKIDKYYKNALSQINKIEKLLKFSNNNLYKKDNKFKKTTSPIKSNFTKSNFMNAVKKIKSYVKKGDVIQTVVSQRWETKYEDDPINLYRSLRKLNPSPYMFYLKMEKSLIVGASPEVLVRLENNKVESRPIAGTRPRGIDTEEDLKMEKDLLSDPKELAEHVMLVDLARNDISRVCKNSTVNVTEMMGIERYSHVMHIVSHVEGLIDKKKDAFDLLKSTFPAGTLSGAPKIRAMQIINELEPNQRGPYGGSVGYFGFSGNMDMSIVIRSFYIKNKTLYFQAGAGIVADSIPKNEYDETKNKSKAMLNAIRKSLNNE